MYSAAGWGGGDLRRPLVKPYSHFDKYSPLLQVVMLCSDAVWFILELWGLVTREDNGAFSPEDFMQADVWPVDPQIILYQDKND